MKKFVLTVAILLMAVSLVSAQQVNDSFSSMGSWRPGYGDWSIQSGRLVQGDTRTGLARIDRRVSQSGTYELEFTIRYVDGGYRSQSDLSRGEYHAGFGIHVGVENPALGKMAWGAGESYLLWLNLDTREETRRNHPEHYGFRAQVYESESNSRMSLARSSLVRQNPDLRRVTEEDYVSIDIIAALRNLGVDLSINDLMRFLDRDVPINIRVNTRSGEIGVLDPTAPVRFWFPVDPSILQGDYFSLRTNSLAASFNYFRVD
jgi:hypothetical protein